MYTAPHEVRGPIPSLDAATSNGVALIDVVNRGRERILAMFNRGAAVDQRQVMKRIEEQWIARASRTQ